MARSSSAKNGKNSKNTYRASGSKSSKSSSSGARHNSSASGSKKRMSRLEQRRAQQQNLIRSVVLAGFGILAIALVLVPGQSFWNVLRSWLFGAFGVVTYFVGPFLLYLAYLLASGYHVGTFIGKVLLLAVLLAGTAVIFSDFKVGDTPWQTVKMLFAWGQRKFWTGGVLGVPIGASLLAVCGRPGANIIMIIVILMGLMVFFAVTPVDVVQFISYYIQEFKARRAARAEEETAYDTQLFGHEAEEESLENLTGSLPPMAGESPATPQSGTRRPFDVAPYLEQEEAARRNAAQANPADQAAAAAQAGQPAAQPQQAYTQPGTATYPDMQRAQAAPQGVQHTQSFAPPAQRSDFDVDLGPDASQRALQNAVQHDPLQKIDIGPGGTFGLDPLEQLNHRKYPAPQPEPQPQPQEESFELHLEPEAQQAEEAPVEEDSLNDLIQRAVTGRDTPVAGADVGLPDEDEAESFETPLTPEPDDNAPAASAEDFSTPLEPVEELPEPDDVGSSESADSFETPLVPEPTQPAPAPVTAIPTLGGSFDQGGFDAAKAAWNAGIPVSDLLTGRVSVQAPAPQPTAQPAAAAPKVYSVTDERRPGSPNRLRVSSSMGNSASAPISSPPSVAKAMAKAPAAPAATAPAGVAREADEDASSEATAAFAAQAKEEFPPYTYPSLNLFNAAKPEDERGAAAEMKKNADILVNTLDSFGVKTHILDICRGPSVTRYELQPQAGIKVSRITSLSDDIALNLATAGVRIEAPIPGKPAVGIEVPNKIRSTVSIRGVFESQNYINMRSPLTMALGKDIAGTAQVADLCKMPHLLIAGSTGSGKSVCVNSIIISFLFRSGPEDVKLILIDPKVVELAEYNGIPHLLMPVVTEPRKAAGALGASVAEMERRYKLFAENNVRDIKSYNKLAKQHPDVLEHLPYIAIIIDELADLMMVAGKEVEDYICRIAQKARAAGIHLIVATQRPSVDVITGLIKANIPSRIAFAVSSQIDSRTILDSGGAEKLLGNGDMLFLPVGASKPVRVQGTFVTDEEISAVLNFIKSTSSAQYDEEMIAEMERRAVAEKGGKGSSSDSDDDSGSRDPMFEQAVECVIEAGQASTSLLQRRCKLGYARAARIMDQMEQEKIIGPYEGAKPRAVLLTRAQWQERQLGQGE